MYTREASVKLSATPPALSETKKTSTSVFVMKYSMLLWRWIGVMDPSSMTVLNPARRKRHSISCSIDVNCEKTIDFSVCFLERCLYKS